MATGFSRRIIARTIAAKLLAEPEKRRHWIQALAAYLVDNGRAEEADLISNDIAYELFAQGGILGVKVNAARELGSEVRSHLSDILKSETGAKQVELTESVDPGLIGGLVANTPSAVLDLSVRSKLKLLTAVK